jgi:hypothetical protein
LPSTSSWLSTETSSHKSNAVMERMAAGLHSSGQCPRPHGSQKPTWHWQGWREEQQEKKGVALPRTGTAPAVGLGASTTPIRTQLPLQLTARCLPILRLSGVRTHLVTQATQPVTRPVIGGFGGAGEHQFRFLGHQNGEGTRVPRAPG